MALGLILTQSVLLVAAICKATSCCEAFEKQSRMFFYGSSGGRKRNSVGSLGHGCVWLRRREIAKVLIFRGIDNWINGLGLHGELLSNISKKYIAIGPHMLNMYGVELQLNRSCVYVLRGCVRAQVQKLCSSCDS
ncbi:hypothetical protein D5086_029332 [Populus alba]|uniref:Uncharacterized protein n=1 Tax=Populus alba TaxID=43335 RepID=A0ACC4AT74_POPAL